MTISNAKVMEFENKNRKRREGACLTHDAERSNLRLTRASKTQIPHLQDHKSSEHNDENVE